MTGQANLDVLAVDTADVGESPLYDPRDGTVYWVDLLAGVLSSCDLLGKVRSDRVAGMLGAVGLRTGTGLVGIDQYGFGVIDDGVFTPCASVGGEIDFRMNDAKVDPRGRFWGNRAQVEFAAGAGTLHVWTGGPRSCKVKGGFGLPNGLAWSPDERTMYLADSTAHVLLAAEFDVEDGAVGAFRPLVSLTQGLPDGLTVDADGGIWVAMWGGGRIVRISPTGKIDRTIELPVSQPSACAFGGGSQLLVTSARRGLTPAELAGQPFAGSVFTIDVGTHGLPASYCGATE